MAEMDNARMIPISPWIEYRSVFAGISYGRFLIGAAQLNINTALLSIRRDVLSDAVSWRIASGMAGFYTYMSNNRNIYESYDEAKQIADAWLVEKGYRLCDEIEWQKLEMLQ